MMSVFSSIIIKIKPYVKNLIYAGRFTYLPWKRNVLLIGTPEYNNVGDSILTIATLKLLSDNLDSANVIEITRYDYYRYKSMIKRCLRKHDVVTFQPGGNMGNVWLNEENWRRDVIASFSDNRVVLLPQTIYYEDTIEGQASLRESQKLYSSNRNLVITAREKTSYELMRKYYPNNKVILTPDMALYLDKHESKNVRSGVLLCLRNDSERMRTKSDDEKIIQALGDREYKYMDMYSKENPTPETRKRICNEKIDEFTKAEVVITDRLHGMICCALTETPCVVLSNNHHKVKGVYEWLKELSYIKYVESVDEISNAINKVMSEENRIFDNKKLMPYFEQITASINGE